VIGREDLGAGYMSVQAIHAAIQFQHDHPEFASAWHQQSNYLGFLSVNSEEELQNLIDRASAQNIPISVFREPDIDNQITAIALAPCRQSKKLCSQLPLALKVLK
jgi:hypothetical protein